MCKRALGYGGGGGDGDGDCEKDLTIEQENCSLRKWRIAHPDYYRGCMDRAMERYQKCKKGEQGPPEWGDKDEETGLDHGR